MKAILLLFHCKSNAGYAINALLPTFYQMAKKLVAENKIHISFTELNGTTGDASMDEYQNLIEFDHRTTNKSKLTDIEQYVRTNSIDVVFGFDQPVNLMSYRYLRKGGVQKIISYWGAPMSSLNSGVRLKLRQLQVFFTSHSPNHYIFESTEMARSAYAGRGIAKRKISIVYLGVDTDKFKPATSDTTYAQREFNIPKNRKIIYYSGHMEQRKGVAVLMAAARHLFESMGRRDFHFLILGNKNGEEQLFIDSLKGSAALSHVTFAGYRTDVKKIIPSCYLGTVASTGWDSFTVSSLEIASCGLPLVVSNLQGLAETVDNKRTGFLFKPGDYQELSHCICKLIDQPETRKEMGKLARERTLAHFSRERQIEQLTATVTSVVNQ